MDRRQKIAAAALAHADCSSVLNVPLYTEAVIRPVDRTDRLHSFYFGNKDQSTCALAAVGFLRIAGCEEDECVGTYFPPSGERNAMQDIQELAKRCGAWRAEAPDMPPMKQGDVWVIANSQGMDAHTGVCTADAVVAADVSWTVPTVEGGQVPTDEHGRAVAGEGCTAQLAFTRHFVKNGARWMLGNRYLIGYASADALPVPDDMTDPDQTIQPT